MKILRQYIVPHHPLSRFMGWFTTRTYAWLKNWQIRTFVKTYNVDMSQAQHEKAEDYVNFTHFFTRHLLPDARPLAQGDDSILSPADSCIAQKGKIDGYRLIQAKKHSFSVDVHVITTERVLTLLAPWPQMPARGTTKSLHVVRMSCM